MNSISIIGTGYVGLVTETCLSEFGLNVLHEKSREIVRGIYNVPYLRDTPFVFTSLETAERIKYASNAFLATKIAVINEVAGLCDAANADIRDIDKAMGMDGRIGKYFLHSGPGFGGSCLPKDTRAPGQDRAGTRRPDEQRRFCRQSQRAPEAPRCPEDRIRALRASREGRRRPRPGLQAGGRRSPRVAGRGRDPRDHPEGRTDQGLRSASDGECPATRVRRDPRRRGRAVRCGHPGRIGGRSSNLLYAVDEYDAAEGADALVILTEWNQFRHLDLPRIAGSMRGKRFFDFRNLHEPSEITKVGLIYEGLGRSRA